VDYHRGKGGDVDRLFLTGGGSKLRGLAPFLGSAMGLNVQMLESLRGINVQAKTMDGNMAESMQADFSVAVGNALHIFF
jgi:type IV pilus assembly protein PilM